MSNFIHNLGVEASDIITGFKGIVVARAEHLTGCNTYGITPKLLKDGKRGDTEWFDEGRVKVTGKGIKPTTVAAPKNGADTNADNPRIN